MQLALKRHLSGWFSRKHGPDAAAVVLSQRRIFILPTRYGYLFAIALLLMLSGSVNYNLSLGFVLTFLLGAMAINSILYAFRNLARLRVTPGKAGPVFAGEIAEFKVLLENSGGPARHAIGIARGKSAARYCDVPENGVAVATLRVPAQARGSLRPGRFTLFTRFPLGLFRAWSYLELDMHCIVYPRPEPPPLALPPLQSNPGEGNTGGQGSDDYYGLRAYHPGDSPRQIAWKADARGQGLLTKQFSGRADARLMLDWHELPDNLPVEAKLSRLTRWVLDADAQGVSFGLRLPETTLESANGAAHCFRCLEALALFAVNGDR